MSGRKGATGWESNPAEASCQTRPRSAPRSIAWRVPRGKSIEAVVRDATRQVIANYGDTLRRLADD